MTWYVKMTHMYYWKENVGFKSMWTGIYVLFCFLVETGCLTYCPNQHTFGSKRVLGTVITENKNKARFF